MRRSRLALGDERIRRLERAVPASAHEGDPDAIAADEAHARGVAVSLGETLRLGVELVRASKVARERRVDAEVVDDRPCDRGVGCERDLERALDVRDAGSEVEVVLRHADRGQRVSSKLVEPELGRHGEGRLGARTCLFGLARDRSDAGREGENPCRCDGNRVAGELLRPREMLLGGIVLAAIPEDAREERLRLGCALPVTDRQQCVARGLERLLLAGLVIRAVERDGSLEQDFGSLGVVRPERERVLVLRSGDDVAVERERAIASRSQRSSRALDQLVVATTGRPDELECGAPVVGEHLGVILGPAQAVDPFGDRSVPLCAVGARDLAVRDVAHERVRERELALALQR